MKKWLILIIVALMFPIVLALDECDGLMTPRNVPCLLITSWNYPDSCNTYSVKVYDATPTLLDERTLDDYGVTGKCNTTWNYSTTGSYTINISSGDSIHLTIEHEEDTMASLAIMLLVMGITAVIFWIGYRGQFTGHSYANYIIKKCIYLCGVWMLVLTITIAITIADNFGLGVTKEMFRILWFAHTFGYILTVFLFWTAVQGGLKLWKMEKEEKRMGYE